MSDSGEPEKNETPVEDPATIQSPRPEPSEEKLSVARLEEAVQARHAAEVALLREQVRRLEVEKELAEARAKVTSSSESTDEFPAEPASRAARRKREREWDKLSYVPVENFHGNPFRGPDAAVHLPNVSRPQCFALDHDPVLRLLSEQKTPMRYEYEILHPLLYYFWGIQQFMEQDFPECILSPDSDPADRAAFFEALKNSLTRVFEWLAVRHALIEKRARTPKSEHSAQILEHYQNEVYAFVGSAPHTSAWLDSIETAFQDKVFVYQLKNLAQQSAAGKKASSSSSSEGGGQGAAQAGTGKKKPRFSLRAAGKDSGKDSDRQ